MRIEDAIEIIKTQSLENGIELTEMQVYAQWKSFCDYHTVHNASQPQLKEIRQAFDCHYFGGWPTSGNTALS